MMLSEYRIWGTHHRHLNDASRDCFKDSRADLQAAKMYAFKKLESSEISPMTLGN